MILKQHDEIKKKKKWTLKVYENKTEIETGLKFIKVDISVMTNTAK